MEADVKELECSDIRRFSEQPRQYFNKQRMKELQASIEEIGQRRPGTVRALPKGDTHKYELVDGERRWLACQKAGIPFSAVIRKDINEVRYQFLESFIANGTQETLTTVEQMNAILRIKRDFKATNKRVAELIGRSEDWVAERAVLRKLDLKVIEMMSSEQKQDCLSFSHGLLLVKLPPERQVRIAEIIVGEKLKTHQVRDVIRNDHTIIGAPGHEFLKYMTLLKRARETSEVLKDKKRGFALVLADRSRREVELMGEIGDQAIKNLTIVKEALDRILRDRRNDGLVA